MRSANYAKRNYKATNLFEKVFNTFFCSSVTVKKWINNMSDFGDMK